MTTLPGCLVLAALGMWAAGGVAFLAAGVIVLGRVIRRERL